jgi:hypothetical protein
VQIYGHDLFWAVLVAYYLCSLLVGAGVGTLKSELVQTFIGLIVSIADIRQVGRTVAESLSLPD